MGVQHQVTSIAIQWPDMKITLVKVLKVQEGYGMMETRHIGLMLPLNTLI